MQRLRVQTRRSALRSAFARAFGDKQVRRIARCPSSLRCDAKCFGANDG